MCEACYQDKVLRDLLDEVVNMATYAGALLDQVPDEEWAEANDDLTDAMVALLKHVEEEDKVRF
jgi:hypothetical protein